MSKKTYFVDIDQTISTGYIGASLAESIAYYRDRGVVVPDGIGSWPDLFQLPDVARQHEVLPGALIGAWRLAEHGELFYATARKSDVHQITHDWLFANGFPKPESVIFVEGVGEKLVALATHAGPLVLVDDRWRQLLNILGKYGHLRSLSGLSDRLTLVAFGAQASALPASPVVPVVALPKWSQIADVLMKIHEDVSLQKG